MPVSEKERNDMSSERDSDDLSSTLHLITVTSVPRRSEFSQADDDLSPLFIPTEDDIKVVGSVQIQQASGRRRKKSAAYQCPFRNIGCIATFTARHNLRYHIFAHRGEKPYRCRNCGYATSSPAPLKRHQKTCKATIAKEKNNLTRVPEHNEEHYKCRKCKYATDSPSTMEQHEASCKVRVLRCDPDGSAPLIPALHTEMENEFKVGEEDSNAITSPQIQRGVDKQKEGNYVCPFRNDGCNATFVDGHNLMRHINGCKRS